MPKWGMVIDLEKCTGCQACTVACGMENSRLPGENWQDVVFYNEGTSTGDARLKWFPRPCQHCENPSCVAVCPTRATYKDDDGFVLIDWDRCIGCKYCMIACPYGVRFYTDEKPLMSPDMRKVFPAKGDASWAPPWKMPDSKEDWKHGVGVQPPDVVSKCTFCHHRVSTAPAGTVDLDPSDPKLREHTPACVVTCAPGARFFGDLNNPNSEVNRQIASKNGQRLLDHLGNKPQVYYLAGPGGAVPSSRSTGNGNGKKT